MLRSLAVLGSRAQPRAWGARGFATGYKRNKSTTKKCLGALAEADLKGKNVLVRVDFNVPMDKSTGEIKDDTRIRSSLPSIQFLREKGARVVLCSHVGRPRQQGSFDGLYMQPLSTHLSEILDAPVTQCSSCIGEEVRERTQAMADGDVVMLENVRFHPEETQNKPAFSSALAADTGAQVYVNDAFGTAHRAHSSTEGVVAHIAGPRVAGLLLSKELEFLSGAVEEPKRPFAAIVGGAKVSTKIDVLEALIGKADKLVLGGAMVFTFFKARGLSVGASMVEEESLELALSLEKKAKEMGVELLLPEDVVVAESFAEDATYKVVPVEEIPDGYVGLDVGPHFLARVEKALDPCRTVLWNGPMGVFEWRNFAKGTTGVARKLADLTGKGAVTIVGGGDSVSAVMQCGLAGQMSHISTGGGASLELLEGRVLPGVACLDGA